MGIILKEHVSRKLIITEEKSLFESEREKHLFCSSDQPTEILQRTFKKERGKEYFCFNKHQISEKEITLYSDYFVGVDWLTKDKSRYIQVEPKLNSKAIESFEEVFDKEIENITDDEIEQLNEIAKKEIETSSKDYEIDVIGMLMQIMVHPEVSKHTNNLLLIDWEDKEIENEPFLFISMRNFCSGVGNILIKIPINKIANKTFLILSVLNLKIFISANIRDV